MAHIRNLGSQLSTRENLMKFINMFLVGYFVLVIGVTLALWQSGVLKHMSPIWIAIGVIVAVGLGIMMSVSSGKPDTEITKS